MVLLLKRTTVKGERSGERRGNRNKLHLSHPCGTSQSMICATLQPGNSIFTAGEILVIFFKKV
jgi:hypothetical protein